MSVAINSQSLLATMTLCCKFNHLLRLTCLFAKMHIAARLYFLLMICPLILGAVGNHEVELSPSQKASTFLREAVRNLINYTAVEVEAHLDMNGIGSTIAGIAYQKFTKQLGKWINIVL